MQIWQLFQKIEDNTLKLFPEFGGYGHELDLSFDIVFEIIPSAIP